MATIKLKGEVVNGQLKVDLPSDIGDGLIDVELTLPEDRMPTPVVNIELEYCNISIIVTRAGMELWRTDFHATGLDWTHMVVEHMRRTHNLMIGSPTAETLILDIGSALPLDIERTKSVSGRNLENGNPARIEVTSIEIRDMLENQFISLENQTKQVFTPRELPPNTSVYPPFLPTHFLPLLHTQPVKLVGKYALVGRLDERLQAFLGIPVVRADDQR